MGKHYRNWKFLTHFFRDFFLNIKTNNLIGTPYKTENPFGLIPIIVAELK